MAKGGRPASAADWESEQILLSALHRIQKTLCAVALIKREQGEEQAVNEDHSFSLQTVDLLLACRGVRNVISIDEV